MEVHSATIVPKLWGYEKHLVNTALYCGKILVALPNGMACSIHYHKNKTETFHIVRGRLQLQLFSLEGVLQEKTVLNPGDSLTLKPLTPHRFWAIGELCEFIEISTPDAPEDSYRLVDSGPIARD
jgi:mannose-6-phosphate isomerase-like protein (cupin superfamily)